MESDKPKPITSKTGSKNFIKELEKRQFPDAAEILLEMNGRDVNKDFFKEHGFKSPILVRETNDLGIKIPPVTDLNVLLKLLVPDLKDVDVIDVEKQSAFKMSVIEFFKYMMDPDKTRVLNLISLEVSKTRLSEFIEPPKIVRDIDWIHCYWTPNKFGHKPTVPSSTEKYCLISPTGSFTDFHVDFSGTSVWYHMVTGRKIFYLIKPNAVNNHLFWKWSSSYHREAQFFGDQVDNCYKLTLNAGETLLLPTGWIHAVYTPVDSLVYGGNFLNSFNVKEQFAVYEMELREKVIEKYLHPHFRELNWFAAEGLCKEIDELLQSTDILSVPYHLLSAIKVAQPTLKAWSAKLSVQEKSLFNCDQLFKDMNRIIRLYERAAAVRNTEKRESTRVKKKPHSDDFILYDEFKAKKPIRLEPEVVHDFLPHENEEESSSDSWKVKTDSNNALSVTIRRCITSDGIKFESPHRTSEFDGPQDPAMFAVKHEQPGHPLPKKLILLNNADRTYRVAPPLKMTLKNIKTEEPTVKTISPKTDGPTSFSACGWSTLGLPSESPRTRDVDSILSTPWSTSSLASTPSRARQRLSSPKSSYILTPTSQSEPQPSTSSACEDTLERSVHQDDDYIYPGLDFSDDEEPPFANSTYSDDKAWSPSTKSVSVTPKTAPRPQRFGKTKIAIEKGLEAAAAKPGVRHMAAAVFPPRKFIQPIIKPSQRSKPAPSLQSPSTTTSSKAKPSPLCSKKGGSTAKQRLGKILKIHRMRQ
ncbi:JmjC domain, hydroxylase [Nesidiocoris tenuis]|uniref:JmjC domain, hydroxylase n=1 Tax=Nesidiocoris tenuis TaxID=355587 RepID=A0ABN7AE11_9HEMI|nr:JmjC domain, hydroxylase [Nesidiocoris tenuis]